MTKTIIRYKGQTVRCYGAWLEDSNAIVVWYSVSDPDGGVYEAAYCDGGNNWTDVVRKLIDSPWGQKREIEELIAC